jgi:hypothetical protein
MSPRGRNTGERPGGSDIFQHAGYLASHVLCFALLAAAAGPAPAFTVSITPGAPKTVYLQVGVGTFTGMYDAGGTPGNNPTINTESVTVPANAVGNGTAQAMTTDSTQTRSFWDNFVYCSVPTQLYIGGFYRTAGVGAGMVSVTATVPAALVNGAGDTISFSTISWTSSGNQDTGAEVFPTGAFTAGAVQTVGTIAQNQWAESCLTFSYRNNTFPAAGTYTGRVLYTLTAP